MNMVFWIVVTLATLIVAAAVLGRLFRASGGAAADNADVGVYRDQMAEIDRDRARGVLSDTEAGQVRTEVARRLLQADRAAVGVPRDAPRAATLTVAALAGLVIVGGSLVAYRLIGAPGYPDFPMSDRLALSETLRAERPTQAEAEAAAAPRFPRRDTSSDPTFGELMDKLRAAVVDNPDDRRGLQLLARNEARLGNYAAAADAQARLVAAMGDAATADELASLVEILVAAAGGQVSARAETAINRTLALDPTEPRARYFAGLLNIQIGRPDRAFAYWRDLLEQGPEGAPWMAPIRSEIESLARMAGVDYVPPALPAGPGPTAADIAAAQDMTDEQRQEMIRGMVGGLSDRLATQGGPASDWARLIRALGVLGDTEQAAAIWAEAQQIFADSTDLPAVQAAAVSAGVAAP